MLRKVLLLLGAFGVFLCGSSLHAEEESSLVREVHSVRDSLQTGLDSLSKTSVDLVDERADLLYQLGGWNPSPFLGPLYWSQRSKNLYALAQIKQANYIGLDTPEDFPAPRSNAGPDKIPPDPTSRLLLDLRRAIDREQLDSLAAHYTSQLEDTLYYPHRMLVAAVQARIQHQPDSALAICERLLDRRVLKLNEWELTQATPELSASMGTVRDPLFVARATLVIARALEKNGQYQEALDTLRWSLRMGGFSDDALFLMGYNLVRLGRVKEATRLFELALDVNPFHERAHYFLGNGYARYNYTQLEERYPDHFEIGYEPNPMIKVQAWLEEGQRDKAVDKLEQVVEYHPEWVAPAITLASPAWESGDLERVEELCFAVLKMTPEHGRAHAIFARAQEVRRMQQSVYRQRDEEAFANTPMPDVPRIEEYIINWNSLTERHQKVVALAVHPWRCFLPVLIETGATHYIKPLHMKLSECPYMQSLADARIGLDSRLWDDVRGCGGHHTVTGVEDVERTIYGGSNTVLHELTHQVHGILTETEKLEIEELYRKAKADEEAGKERFMSRYQGLTEWEYFAEGVNAYHSPRRNENDPREVVRERLYDLDPALKTLVERMLAVEDMTPFYTVGRLNAARELIEQGLADSALAMVRGIPEEDQDDRDVLLMTSHLLSLLNRDEEAVTVAETATELYPQTSEGYEQWASAVFFTNGYPQAALELLGEGMVRSGIDEPHRLFLEAGRYHWLAGRYTKAIASYNAVLEVQNDHPVAHWGLGAAWGDSSMTAVNKAPSGLLDSATVHFEKALATRTGWLDLRLAYARILLMHGEVEAADRQLDEAANLRPDHPDLKAMLAFRALLTEPESLSELMTEVTPDAPDLLRVVWACKLGLEARGKAGETLDTLLREINDVVPYWVYSQSDWEYEARGVYPRWQRAMLDAYTR